MDGFEFIIQKFILKKFEKKLKNSFDTALGFLCEILCKGNRRKLGIFSTDFNVSRHQRKSAELYGRVSKRFYQAT